jgi:hypothetical protein
MGGPGQLEGSLFVGVMPSVDRFIVDLEVLKSIVHIEIVITLLHVQGRQGTKPLISTMQQ